jgi:flagellar basal-body rod protein FlgC
MSLFTIFQISSQGMTAQRERLETAAANLANSNTTRTEEGGPYRRRDVVFESVAVGGGAGGANSSSFGTFFDSLEQPAQGVRATTVIAEQSEGVQRYQPDHPDADANGYVHMPDVDPLEETVNMISAARSFEANTTAFNTAKEMARASLKLGEA